MTQRQIHQTPENRPTNAQIIAKMLERAMKEYCPLGVSEDLPDEDDRFYLEKYFQPRFRLLPAPDGRWDVVDAYSGLRWAYRHLEHGRRAQQAMQAEWWDDETPGLWLERSEETKEMRWNSLRKNGG